MQLGPDAGGLGRCTEEFGFYLIGSRQPLIDFESGRDESEFLRKLWLMLGWEEEGGGGRLGWEVSMGVERKGSRGVCGDEGKKGAWD